MKKFAISILNYNSSRDTIALLKSLQKYSNHIEESDIWVVEGASSDQKDAQLLHEYLGEYKYINYIVSEQNLGYAGGNNLAICKILEQNYDYAVVMNPDVVIEELNFFDRLDEAGLEFDIFAPKILYGSNRDLIYSAWGELNHCVGLTTMVGKKQRDLGQYNIKYGCDWVTGCVMIIKTEVVRKIGLLPDRYFLYFEEADYCLSARNAGYKIGYTGLTQCYHNVSSTVGRLSDMQLYYMVRNQRRFSLSHISWYCVPIFWIWYFTYWIGGYSYLAVKSGNYRGIGSIFRGLVG